MLALVLASTPTHAQPQRIELQWSAPPECPGTDAVTAAAERLLLDHDAELHARGLIEAQPGGGYALTLVIEHPEGARVHHQQERECTTLAELAALLVAVAADPITVVEAHPVARGAEAAPIVPEPVDTSALDTAVPELGAPTPAPTRARVRRRPTGWIRVAGIVGVAELPTVDAGLGITGAIELARWRVELGLSHLFAQQRQIPGLARIARMKGLSCRSGGCAVVVRSIFGVWVGVGGGRLPHGGRRWARTCSPIVGWATRGCDGDGRSTIVGHGCAVAVDGASALVVALVRSGSCDQRGSSSIHAGLGGSSCAGGPRAGQHAGTSLASPTCSSIFFASRRSVISAIGRIRAPQLGHASTSISNTRRMS